MPRAVVVVDMLNEFLHGRPEQRLVPAENAPGLIANVRALVAQARRAYVPVVYVACAHDADDLMFRAIRPHALRGTWEAQVVADLAPCEWVVEKKVYDGFHETQLHALLRGLAVDELYLAGVQTDCCVHATGQGAIFRGFRACVVAECTDTINAERQRVGLERYRDLIGPVVSLGGLTLES
jgi:nicotinamidase-related amidase